MKCVLSGIICKYLTCVWYRRLVVIWRKLGNQIHMHMFLYSISFSTKGTNVYCRVEFSARLRLDLYACCCRRKWRLTDTDCVLTERPKRCPTLSNPIPWQSWMAAYPSYTLQMKKLFPGWPIMVHDTHIRRQLFGQSISSIILCYHTVCCVVCASLCCFLGEERMKDASMCSNIFVRQCLHCASLKHLLRPSGTVTELSCMFVCMLISRVSLELLHALLYDGHRD